MAWILLIIAGLFEIGWPLGFKLASMHSKYFIWFIGLSILSMGLSGYFLSVSYTHLRAHDTSVRISYADLSL